MAQVINKNNSSTHETELNPKFYPQEFNYEPKWYFCGVIELPNCGCKDLTNNGGGSNG